MEFNLTYQVFKSKKLTSAVCLLMAALLCISLIPMTAVFADGIDYSAVCKLIPYKASYATGESIQFTLNAQYATPADTGKPQTVKFGIPIPDTTPQVQLPMFYDVGSGEYEGVPMYTLNYNGSTIDLYLKSNDSGKRWIEFTLDAGSTVQGTISMILPNGISEPVPAFNLTPQIISEGDYGTNKLLQGGTTSVAADFGWNNVKKTADMDNIGIIGVTTKDPDRITYTITADSLSSGFATGRIFTEHYVLSDTIDLSGLNYADGELTETESGGISTFSIDGTPVLDIAAPLASLAVDKQVTGGRITAFTIEYSVFNTTLDNTDGSAKELPNLHLDVALLLSAMKLNAGSEETKVTNTAKFDAYSPFGEHHESTAAHTAYTQDRYSIEKTVYEDAACTIPASDVTDAQDVWYKIVTENNSSIDGTFTIADRLPEGMIYQSATPATPAQSGQNLTWSGITIPSGSTYTIILNARFDASKFASNPLHNTVILSKDGQRLSSDYADVKYLAGIIDDTSIVYEKSVDNKAAGDGDKLRYTITARNNDVSEAARFITIVDKWPGAGVRPTKVTGCSYYELFDAAGNVYTIAEAQSPSVEIATIKLYNVSVPKNGGKATVYVDGIVKNPIAEIKNVIVGQAGQNLAGTYSVGVSLNKSVYEYDDASGIGEALTNADAVVADQIVCYQMAVKNLTGIPMAGLTLTDKLPAGLTPVSGTVQGVSSQALIKHGSSYTPVTLSSGVPLTTYTPYTSGVFSLEPNETATIYIFAKVSATAITKSKGTGNCITNAAYVNLPGSLKTGDATANIYTFVETSQAFYIKKSIVFVADYDEALTTATTRLLSRVNDSRQWNKNDIVWPGAYVGYKLEMINRNTTEVNKDPVRVYELIDTLPDGMEFIGVCTSGNNSAYKVTESTANALKNLSSQLIRDGETGSWSNTQYEAQALTCHYDKATNTVHVTFNEDSSGFLSAKYHANGANTDLKPSIYLIARVKDDAEQNVFRNTVYARVGDTVKLNPLGDSKVSISDGTGEYDGYKLISNYYDVSTVVFKPGIAKEFVGHYFPTSPATPETIPNESSLFPGESLRFRLTVGAGVISGAIANRIHANIQDFVVTDILPAEYVYRPGSATVTFNEQLNINVGTITSTSTNKLPRGSFEPTIELLADGRTKLTWNFNGPSMRLFFSLASYNHLYFVHLITYDTNWNPAFLKSYGNYTNNASVTHSQNFSTVYSGMPDYDRNSVSAGVVVNAFGAAGTSAAKSVTNEAGATATSGDKTPYVSIPGAGSKVTYTLRVTNSTNAAQHSETQSIVIIDELPRGIGDTGVVNRTSRGSEFTVLFDNSPNVTVSRVVGSIQTPIDSDNYTVRFGMSANGLNATGDWAGIDSGGRINWNTISDGKNAIRIAFDADYSIAAGESIIVRFDACAADDADPTEIAWNSFGYSYKSFAEGKLSEKIYAEPQRVGIKVPGAEIAVKKVVTGDPAPAGTLFTFRLMKDDAPCADVKYTLSKDVSEHRTTTDGSFKLSAADTATLFVSPGNGYSIEEGLLAPDYSLVGISATATGDGSYVTPKFTFKNLIADSRVGAICTNDYDTPAARDLTVKKVWGGLPNPSSPTSVQMQLYKGGVADGSPVTLDAGSGWTYTWPALSTAETWTVNEVNIPAGYTKTVSGNDLDGFTITNTYTTPNITLSAKKVWDGASDPSRPTSVNVQLYGNNVAAFGEMTLDDSNGWQCTWPGLSPHVTWTVRETTALSPQYSTSIARTGDEFVITNTYTAPDPERTSVRVEKQWLGDSNPDQPESVSIRLNRDGKEYDVKTLDDSTNWRYTWYNLAKGHKWTVEEVSPLPAGYTSTIEGNQFDGFVVKNTYTAINGSLTLSKEILGTSGERDREWTFVVNFSDGGTYSYTGSKFGTLKSNDTITLKHGQSVTFNNIPYGTSYAILEKEANEDGYVTECIDNSGTIDGHKTAEFINKRMSTLINEPGTNVPKTGDSTNLMLWLGVLLISGLCLLFLCFGTGRRRDHKE